MRAAYKKKHETCAICGRAPTFGRWLEVHHICGASLRIDHPANLLMLCKTVSNGCHDMFGNWKNIGLQLQIKFQTDPESWEENKAWLLATKPRLKAFMPV